MKISRLNQKKVIPVILAIIIIFGVVQKSQLEIENQQAVEWQSMSRLDNLPDTSWSSTARCMM